MTGKPLDGKKIVLALLPFWYPLIPPLGVGCLKSYLQSYGYKVKTVDANLEARFRELFDAYYENLRKEIPPEKQSNFFNIGNQVLRNHLMAHLNFGIIEGGETPGRRKKYEELLKELVMKTFFTPVEIHQLKALDRIVEKFYTRLKPYVLELVDRENPAVVGLSVYGDTLPASAAAFRWIKEKKPAVITVMGGGIFADQLAKESPSLEFFLEKNPYIDKIVIGEGEALMLKLLSGDLPGTRRVYTQEDNHMESLDLETVGVPDFSDLEPGYYPYLAGYASRSCPYQCNFCSETVSWGRYRKKSGKQVARELVELYGRHGNQLFLMGDSLLNPVITGLANAMIEEKVSLYWDGYLRADGSAGDTGNTMLWRRGGFYRARFGLESGSQRLLDLMNKRGSVRQNEAAITALAYAGVKTTTYWVVSYPGETEEDFQLTLDFLEKNKNCIYEAEGNVFNYFPTGQVNSPAWAKNNKGVLLYPEWAKDFLITQTWVLNEEPSREISYGRLNRLVLHCKKLGIPNPYSLHEVYRADERWKSFIPMLSRR
jgi:radical SAM superfamily enzyme YgiQ (UPF0313 family)